MIYPQQDVVIKKELHALVLPQYYDQYLFSYLPFIISSLLSFVHTVQVCDATAAEQGFFAGLTKYILCFCYGTEKIKRKL
jgi:hypothetical protein